MDPHTEESHNFDNKEMRGRDRKKNCEAIAVEEGTCPYTHSRVKAHDSDNLDDQREVVAYLEDNDLPCMGLGADLYSLWAHGKRMPTHQRNRIIKHS